MKIYNCKLTSGILKTSAFVEKALAQFAVNPGLKCSHSFPFFATGATVQDAVRDNNDWNN